MIDDLARPDLDALADSPTYATDPTGVVRTVLGDVLPASLGPTSAHEHIWVGPGLMTSLEPEFRLDDLEKVVGGVRDFVVSGGRTLVDALPLVEGRSGLALAEVSRRTGVNVIAATGFHRLKYYSASHWIHSADPEAMTRMLCAEILSGMDERCLLGPEPLPTKVRAGVIKIATEFHHIPAAVHPLLTAVAHAHRLTGAPIMAHTEHGTAAHQVLDAFEAHGVPADAIMLSHSDRNPDAILHIELASRGCFLGYDWLGRVRSRPDSAIYQLISDVAAAGLSGQVTLGLDLVRHTYWPQYGGGPGLAYLFGEFVPRLARAGVDADTIELISCYNPQRWLTFRRPMAPRVQGVDEE